VARFQQLAARVQQQIKVVTEVATSGQQNRAILRTRYQQSPGFRAALGPDVAVTLAFRGEGKIAPLSRSQVVAEAVRLSVVSDAYLAQLLYRARISLLRRGVPCLPRACHFLAMSTSQVCIGNPVVIEPGLYIPHGQVVVDGFTDIGSGAILFPWTTIGLRAGNFQGPRLSSGVHVGTGAKVIGPIIIGKDVRIGANSVVVNDVDDDVTVVGAPARRVGSRANRHIS